MATTIHLTPPPIEFYLNVITNLRYELNKAQGKVDVYEQLVDEYIKIVPASISRDILNKIDVKGQLPEAHDKACGRG